MMTPTDILPYVEKCCRAIADRRRRAIAGLSMGGMQTLDIAFRYLDRLAYIGVFSSGASLGGGRRGPAAPTPGAAPAAPAAPPFPDWETAHQAGPDHAALRKGLKLMRAPARTVGSIAGTTLLSSRRRYSSGMRPDSVCYLTELI